VVDSVAAAARPAFVELNFRFGCRSKTVLF